MADAQHLLQLFEGGVGVFFDVRLEFLGVELAPMSPALFRSQRTFFGGVQIPINGTPSYCKLPGGLGFGATVLNEFNHPFPQVQRIGFHARKSITLCPNVNMKCYICMADSPCSTSSRSSSARAWLTGPRRSELIFLWLGGILLGLQTPAAFHEQEKHTRPKAEQHHRDARDNSPEGAGGRAAIVTAADDDVARHGDDEVQNAPAQQPARGAFEQRIGFVGLRKVAEKDQRPNHPKNKERKNHRRSEEHTS